MARPRRRRTTRLRRALGRPPPRRGHDRGGPDRDPPRRRRTTTTTTDDARRPRARARLRPRPLPARRPPGAAPPVGLGLAGQPVPVGLVHEHATRASGRCRPDAGPGRRRGGARAPPGDAPHRRLVCEDGEDAARLVAPLARPGLAGQHQRWSSCCASRAPRARAAGLAREVDAGHAAPVEVATMLDEPELRDAAGARAVAEEVVADGARSRRRRPRASFCGAWEGRDRMQRDALLRRSARPRSRTSAPCPSCAAAAWPARRSAWRLSTPALADGHDLVLIFADDDDWPKDLYARLGFRPVGRVRTFLRRPPRRRRRPGLSGRGGPRARSRGRRRSRRSSRPPTAASPSRRRRPARWTPRTRAGPRPTRAAWLAAAGAATRAALARAPDEPVTAIGLAGQMHGVVLAGADGAPVRPALLWPDRRARRRARRLARARAGRPRAARQPARARDGRAAAGLARRARAGRRSPPPDGRSRRRTGCGWRSRARPRPRPATPRPPCCGTWPADGWSADALAAAGVEPRGCPRSWPARRPPGR